MIPAYLRAKTVHALYRSATETYTLVIINVSIVPGSVLGLDAAFPERLSWLFPHPAAKYFRGYYLVQRYIINAV
jgi:hypothetical protein